MLSAICGRGEDRTQYLSACCPTLYPVSYPARQSSIKLAVNVTFLINVHYTRLDEKSNTVRVFGKNCFISDKFIGQSQ
jgi:hypothetical protein